MGMLQFANIAVARVQSREFLAMASPYCPQHNSLDEPSTRASLIERCAPVMSGAGSRAGVGVGASKVQGGTLPYRHAAISSRDQGPMSGFE